MGKSRSRRRSLVAGVAAFAAIGAFTPASADTPAGPAVQQSAQDGRVGKVRWRGVRVPAGILAGVPTGAIPGGVRLRTVYPPYPFGFAADPYFTPPAVVTVPPPIVFVPPPVVVAPPFLYDGVPLGLPFGGGCFVPSDNAGLHGHYGSCAAAFHRQWTSRPD